jgi:toxin ParE1/3/4
MAQVLLSPIARSDLQEASEYGDAAFGIHATDRYFKELDQVFELLAQFPSMARERSEFDPPVRVHHHGRHFIAYEIEQDQVRILRVLSDTVDLARYLRRNP